MSIEVLDILCDLIRLPSVNPMGRDVQGDEYFEYRVTEYLEQLFQRLGLQYWRQSIGPKQDNIVAWMPGDVSPAAGGRVLLLEAHQDTVPVDGMTIPPWEPRVRNGRIYGRGACDIKGGMACMLTALSRLLTDKSPHRPNVLMACSVNEEYGTRGASRIPELWSNASGPLPFPPDAAIIAEPTELNVVVAHKGTVRWKCHTSGIAAHSSSPDRGENAIYHMAKVLGLLEQYASEILPQMPAHQRLGHPTLSVGLVHGGSSVNIVPDRCTIEIDRRVLPAEEPLVAYDQVCEYLQNKLGERFPLQHDPPYQHANGLTDENNTALAELLSCTIRRLGGPGRLEGVPFGTDAPAFATVGLPAVVFGPGSIAQAHTHDEWIAVEQLDLATDMLYEFALSFGNQRS